jgi:hypothetical protein
MVIALRLPRPRRAGTTTAGMTTAMALPRHHRRRHTEATMDPRLGMGTATESGRICRRNGPAPRSVQRVRGQALLYAHALTTAHYGSSVP